MANNIYTVAEARQVEKEHALAKWYLALKPQLELSISNVKLNSKHISRITFHSGNYHFPLT